MAKRRIRQQSELKMDGDLAVHFVNTASVKRRGIATYGELIAWSVAADALGAAAGQRLEQTALERSGDAEAVVARALELRHCLRRLFLAAAAGDGLPAADLAALNDALETVPRRRLVSAGSGCRWTRSGRGDELDRMLWPVLLSAGDVLATDLHQRLGVCAGEDCDLMFVARRAGGSRRKWCSMRYCGGRAKSRKHYHTLVKPRNKAWKERILEERKKRFGKT